MPERTEKIPKMFRDIENNLNINGTEGNNTREILLVKKCTCMVEEKQPVPSCPIHGEES